jgi:hypothetical protein
MDGFARAGVTSFAPAELETVTPDWLASPEQQQLADRGAPRLGG